MSYFGMGATNFAYNYTLLSGGCYDNIAKKYVDKSLCAGDVAATKPGPLYEMRGGFCTNTATGKLAEVKYCQAAPKPASPSLLDNILTGLSVGARPQTAAAPSSKLSKYILPVGLAAAGLGIVLILTKPKRSSAPAAPKTNPARRRRRR